MGLLASCAKEAQEMTTTTVIQVGLAPQTKTYMGDVDSQHHRKLYWSAGDRIAVNGSFSAELPSQASPSQSASFSFNGSLSTPYNVLYPAGIYADASHVTLPAVQTYRSGGFADNMFPMVGYSSSEGTVTLAPLCALVKVSVMQSIGGDADDLLSVSFKGRSNEQVSGSFSVDYQSATLTGTSSAEADKEVKVGKALATNPDAPVEYFIAVPARTYANGFDITVQDRNGHFMVKSKTSSVTLIAGHLYNLPVFEFAPTGTELGIEISSAAEFVKFAQDINNKVYTSAGDGLVASVIADLVFDANTSAAFNATGGIGLKIGQNGDEDYYFNGLLNGNGHKISGLKATVPLFIATGSNGSVKNLTIDNSCSFSFTHSGEADGFFGAVVGYHKGFLENVTVDASVSMAPVSSPIEVATAMGGLVGRVTVGSVDECSFSGRITIPSGFAVTDKNTSIGGLVGRMTNADGIVMNSTFGGLIDNEGQVTGGNNTDPRLIIGGIVGSVAAGTVSTCNTNVSAEGITITLNDGNDHNYTGDIVSHTTNAYHYALAGIAGENSGTLNGCVNNARLLNIFSSDRGTSDVNGRYLEVAGIVGLNRAEGLVKDCQNTGSIIDRANPKMHYVAGIVGRNFGQVNTASNLSSATIGVGTSHYQPYGVRQLRLGGVIGRNEADAQVSNVHNEAAMNVSRLENSTATFSYIGGIIGESLTEIKGSDIYNSGAITQSSGIRKVTAPFTNDNGDQGIFLGGIVGHTTQSVKDVTNSGDVTYTCTAAGIGAQYVHMGGIVGKVLAESNADVDNCSNSAKVSFVAAATNKDNDLTVYNNIYLGGIAGMAVNTYFQNGCIHSGIVKGGDNSQNKNSANTLWVGGIVGHISGTSAITGCKLSGTAYNDHWSNRGAQSYDCPMCGGIAGQVAGEEGVLIPVSNCTVDGAAVVTSRRGACGGIAGAAQYATVSNCTVPIDFVNASSYFYGGIVSLAKNSTISSCSYSGTTMQGSQLQMGGGIVAKLDEGGVIDGCNSKVTTIDKNGTVVETVGTIAGTSVEGSVIKNCHYVNCGLNICSDSLFTGSGNQADL